MIRSCTRVAALLAMLALARFSAGDSVPSRPAALDLSRVRVLDLTHPFDENTLYWPTSPSTFRLQRLAFGMTEGGYFYSANSFCTPEHGGTHLDAPVHFAREGRSVEAIPVRQLVAPGVVIDVSAKTARNPDYLLSLEDLRGFERTHGAIPRGAIVLLRTGWSARWPDRRRYLGDDTPGDASKLHFPSYGREAAEWLIRERAVGALGVDTASIDYGPSRDFAVHRAAARANVPGLENLLLPEELPPTGSWIVALPMKIAGGSGGPLRIVALVP
jgi:kynurenine formamidase